MFDFGYVGLEVSQRHLSGRVEGITPELQKGG